MRKKRLEFLQNICGIVTDVLLCRGDLKDEDKDAKPLSYRELFRYATFHDKFCIALGSIFACITGAIQPMVLVFGGMITSVFLKDREQRGNPDLYDDAKIWLILLGVGGVVALISTYLQSWLLHRGCCDMVNIIRQQFLAAVLRQDATWFGENDSGKITSLLNTNIQKIEEGLGEKLGMLLRGFAMFISSFVVCCCINWQLTLICVTMGPISAWTLGIMGKVIAKYEKSAQEANTEAASVVEESIMNVKTVAACNAQEHMVKKYEKKLEAVVSPAVKYAFWEGFFEGVAFIQIYGIMGITFWVGIVGFYHGWVVRGGDVILIVNTISLTGYYLGLLGPHMMAMVKARIAAAVVYEVIDRKSSSEISEKEGIVLKDVRGDIEVKNVVFKYPTRDVQILKGISWEAKTGESIALVGKSGCGKSTSIGLLTRLYNVVSGEITIDGIPIENINVRSLRQIIGIVEQEPCLFTGTVMENITLSRPGITEKDAKRAAHIARADEFINQLQHKYDTLLGVGAGVALSGGQKQRIAIARAIATDPKILLLDEATSALDTESERVVQAALNRAAKGRTTIIIAHRLSTLKDVNRIYVLDKGVVVEEGTHEGLVRKGGIYAGLAKAQEINQAGQVNEEEFGLSKIASLRKRSQRDSKKESAEGSDESLTFANSANSKRSSSGLWLLYSNLSGHFLKALVALIFACARGMEMPLLAVQCNLAFQALQPENKDKYMHNGMVTFLVAFFCGVLSWITQTAMFAFAGWTAEKMVAKLQVKALRSLLYRPYSSFDQPHSSPASCVTKIAQHGPAIIPAFDFRMFYNLTNLAAIIVGLILATIYSVELGLLGLSLCICLFSLSIMNYRVSNSSRKRKEVEDMSGEYSVEIVEQARTIQLLTVEDHFLKKFSDQLAKSVRYDRRIGFVDAMNFGLTQSFVFFCDLCAYGLATYLIFSGRASVDTVFLAFMGSQIAGWSVMYSAPYFPDVVKAASSAKQLFKLIDDEKVIKEVVGSGEKPEIKGEVSLNKVDFAYPSRRDVMVSKQLTISAKKGQSIALVGASGCGKSTIIALLERFYTADDGQVLIDGNNVRTMNLHYLRSNVALVSQEPVLFKGSIFENITMGVENIPIEKVMEACKTANAAKFVEDFPTGYETDVGEKGKSLSGGQKQRIAIARALVRDPKIILLDEATSALDTESEEVVQKALNDASLGRTSITIAHRLSSIQNCDRIFVIEKGTVVESGSHSDLLHLDGRYARLVEAQQLNTV